MIIILLFIYFNPLIYYLFSRGFIVNIEINYDFKLIKIIIKYTF